ncbi:cell division protein ZapE [Marinobacterium weihaiense]|uniref:AFG1 family ATPase n=1 Tax=Marinobacterium weihaiense TaxID=2851016 RepID=A0ABS6MEX0_9GAMM|nr:cell division protein ZapE [Marinobacterium weihaiense]MBV0934399.1 AFG1 family ATPase [Marinobacterium weihaiense]
MKPGPLQYYQQALRQGFAPDAAQSTAVDSLQQLHDQLHDPLRTRGAAVQGLYLWGAVGRGKTWLMDSFHNSLRVPARRQHFHHFMRWVHQRLFQLKGTVNPLDALAFTLGQEVRVLCLDEFFVSDIGDAVVLGGLVQRLLAQGVVIVTTSNQPPEQLYADGFNRERFVPAINAIQAGMQILAVNGPEDHRLHPGVTVQRYWVQQSGRTPLATAFNAHRQGERRSEPLTLGSRQIHVVQQDEYQLWCRYDQLCEVPLAANDYIQLCDRFRQILLSEVPCLVAERQEARIARGTEDGASRVVAGDRQLPRMSVRDNGVRRFIALVDECYDRGVPLLIEAEVPMDALYPDGYLGFAFKRTLSRLREMQFERFGRSLNA